MFEYRGLDDPNRLLQRELPKSEVVARTSLATGLSLGDIHMGVTFEPFSLRNPQTRVRRHTGRPVPRPLQPECFVDVFLTVFISQAFNGLASDPPQPRGPATALYAVQHMHISDASYGPAVVGAPSDAGSKVPLGAMSIEVVVLEERMNILLLCSDFTAFDKAGGGGALMPSSDLSEASGESLLLLTGPAAVGPTIVPSQKPKVAAKKKVANHRAAQSPVILLPLGEWPHDASGS